MPILDDCLGGVEVTRGEPCDYDYSWLGLEDSFSNAACPSLLFLVNGEHKGPHKMTTEVLSLTHEAARDICKKHGHRRAAEAIVEALPYRADLQPSKVAGLVDVQVFEFARSLIACVAQANLAADRIKGLPARAKQGAALREIRAALENLRGAVGRNWGLAGPLLEIETAEQLGRLLTTEATKELLPANLRSEYIKASGNKEEYIRRGLKRSFLLRAGSRPLTRLIKGAKIAVRRAEQRIPSGAPLKGPLEMALIMQLADHFEWVFEQKAARTEGGPFSKFCSDVFEKLELQSEYSWEHLLNEGLNLHRSSFVVRRRHERHDDPKGDGGRSRRRKPRKQQLSPIARQKTKQNQ